MVASVVAHAVATEAVLPHQETTGHVVVVPVAAIGHVVLLTEVDGVPVVAAVRWVVAHGLPATTVPLAATDGDRGVVLVVLASVLHLTEGVHTSGHTVAWCEPHIAPGTSVVGAAIVESVIVPAAKDLGAHVEAVLSGRPPCVAVAVGAEVAVLATVVGGVVAHAVLTELVLANEQTVGHVVVVPVAAIGHVVRLTEVDGIPFVAAVRWVVAHGLPATTVLGAALPCSGRVVTAVGASVLHLAESV